MRGVRVMMVGVVCALLAGCATLPATDVKATSAVFNGIAIPGDDEAAYSFRYARATDGLGTGHDEDTGTIAFADPGTEPVSFRLRLTLLEPATAYVYEACARATPTDPDVRCFGEQRFTTRPAPAVPSAPLCATTGSCRAGEATTITPHAADLHASGFTRTRPVLHWFEVTPVDGGDSFTTPERGPETLPAGTFGATATGLTPNREYTLRACVRLAGEDGSTCSANEAGFGTETPVCARWTRPCDAQPATGVTDTTAVLHASGFQWSEPVVRWFAYSVRGGVERETPRRGPAIVSSGTFAEDVTGLDPDTSYWFRPCGLAEGDTEPTCGEGTGFTTTSPADRVCGSDSGPDLHCTYEALDVTTTTGVVRVAGLTPDRDYEAWVQAVPKPGDAGDPATPGLLTSVKQTIRPGTTTARFALTGLTPGFITHNAFFCLRAPGVAKAVCIPAIGVITRSGPAGTYERHGGRVTVSGTRYDDASFEWTDTSVEIAALADADGTNARGTVTATRSFHGTDPRVVVTTGSITCMNVIARRATINIRTADARIVSFFVDTTNASYTGVKVLRYYDAKRDSPDDCSPEKGEPRIPWVSFNNGVFEVVQTP